MALATTEAGAHLPAKWRVEQRHRFLFYISLLMHGYGSVIPWGDAQTYLVRITRGNIRPGGMSTLNLALTKAI